MHQRRWVLRTRRCHHSPAYQPFLFPDAAGQQHPPTRRPARAPCPSKLQQDLLPPLCANPTPTFLLCLAPHKISQTTHPALCSCTMSCMISSQLRGRSHSPTSGSPLMRSAICEQCNMCGQYKAIPLRSGTGSYRILGLLGLGSTGAGTMVRQAQAAGHELSLGYHMHRSPRPDLSVCRDRLPVPLTVKEPPERLPVRLSQTPVIGG